MPDPAEDRGRLRKWVDTWRRATTALAVDSQPKTTSGLVEQQMWFRRMRESIPANAPR